MGNRKRKTSRRLWSNDDILILRLRYSNEPSKNLAEYMQRSAASISQMAAKIGIKKSKEYMRNSELSTLFKKGHATWNAGMTGVTFGGKETQFKPGSRPKNTAEIGSYRMNGDGFLQRKIGNKSGSASNRWRCVHEIVWTDAHGPMPPKHIVVFKPGMRTNVLEDITIDKVECISLAENMRRNSMHRLPKELAEIVQLRGAITRQINKREDKKNEEQHQPTA